MRIRNTTLAILWPIIFVGSVALAAAGDRYFSNPASNKDVVIQVNKAGVMTDALKVSGSTGAVNLTTSSSSSSPSGLVTLTSASDTIQLMNPSVDISVKMDNSHVVGRVWTVVNQSSTKIITIVANDSSVIRTVYPLTSGQVVAVAATPAVTASWDGIGTVSSNLASFTPSLNGGLTTSVNGAFWRRNGEYLEVTGSITFTNTGSVTATRIGIPSGLTIDTAKVPRSGNANNGGFLWTGAGNGSLGYLYNNGGTTLTPGYLASSDFNANAFANGQQADYWYRVPITGWTSNKG